MLRYVNEQQGDRGQDQYGLTAIPRKANSFHRQFRIVFILRCSETMLLPRKPLTGLSLGLLPTVSQLYGNNVATPEWSGGEE